MRPNRLVLTGSVLAALLLAACGGGEESTASPGAPPGGDASTSASAPEAPTGVSFTAATLEGGELSSTSLDGSDTVLWFWAPWCTVCRAEADDVVAAADALAGEVDVIGVAGRGEIAAMERFVADTGTGGLTHVVDADGLIWSSYEVFAQPAYAFVDDDGSVEVFVGALGEDALVERMRALAEA
jgi:thiol-disulfide isomerase/thioredoxin